jgi:hypothetical protein
MFKIIIAWLGAFWRRNICDTFENVHPNYHEQCSACNKGGEECSTCPFRDKTYIPKMDFGPEVEYDEGGNINWSSGQDDVPPAPEGVVVMSEGKASRAYIEAKDKDIQAALDVVMQAISANSPEHHLSVLRQVHAHLMRALL